MDDDADDVVAYDVVVVGGGPAGLSAALTLARARRAVLVVDDGQPRNAPAGRVHNYLAGDGTPPAVLLATGRAEVARYGGEVAAGEVTAVVRRDGGFVVRLGGGHAVRARRLLVTSGLVDELPTVPGLVRRWGRDVLHCPYCHGWEVRDKRIGVLASTPLAVRQALLWRQWSSRVLLLTHRQPAPDAEQAARLAARGVTVVAGTVARVDAAGDALTGVTLACGERVALDVLAVSPRLTARSGVLESLGLKPVEAEVHGHVIGTEVPAGPTGATEVPGVWVAGNVANLSAQVAVAAAAGLSAAVAINADLVEADADAAVRAPSG